MIGQLQKKIVTIFSTYRLFAFTMLRKKSCLFKDLSDSHLGQVAIIPRILRCLRTDSFLTLLLAVTPWGNNKSKMSCECKGKPEYIEVVGTLFHGNLEK